MLSEFIAQEPPWSARDPNEVAKRRLTAATFILEVAQTRYETDWQSWSVLRDAVEWSCEQLRLTPFVPGRVDSAPPPGERTWFLASVAMAQRAGDSLWLLGVTNPRIPKSPGHLTHARERYAGDARLTLAAVIATTHAIDFDVDGPGRRLNLSLSRMVLALPATPGRARSAAVLNTDSAVASFSSLLTSPDVGGEAELHVAHIYLTSHLYDPALSHARKAADAARDPATRYSAHVLSAQALERLGRLDDAIGEYEHALEVLPDRQSASLGLATRLVAKGEQDRAFALMERSLAAHPADDDPWRLYFYGDFVHWPDYIRELHEAIK